MYISGENIVMKPYTPVDAYAVMPMAGGIISGGTGGDATLTDGVRFNWVYDPNNPDKSGFTGQGWFAEIEGSPIYYNIQEHNMTLEGILSEFAGDRVDLNDVFQNWQIYVDAEKSKGRDVVFEFQQKLGWTCWSNF